MYEEVSRTQDHPAQYPSISAKTLGRVGCLASLSPWPFGVRSGTSCPAVGVAISSASATCRTETAVKGTKTLDRQRIQILLRPLCPRREPVPRQDSDLDDSSNPAAPIFPPQPTVPHPSFADGFATRLMEPWRSDHYRMALGSATEPPPRPRLLAHVVCGPKGC
jgi:hypothetical protein